MRRSKQTDPEAMALGYAEDADDWGAGASSANGRAVGWVRANRHSVIGVALALTLIALFAFTLSPGGKVGKGGHSTHGHRGPRAARAAVMSALAATTDSGSFNVTYQFSGLIQPTDSTTTTTTCGSYPLAVIPGDGVATPAVACPSSPDNTGLPIHGQATIDTQPYGVVALTQVPGLGTVTVRADDTNVWEVDASDPGLVSNEPSAGSGSPLSGFASLVESTLGEREGAMAMLSLASSSGYLALEQQQVTAADDIGPGSVDSVPVERYRVSITPQQQGDLPGLSVEQTKTINAALALLTQDGYQGYSVVISIDPSGFVRQSQSTAQFADGTTATSEATFSDFGCAGTVLMPGQTGSDTPPVGCVSPDTGAAATTTTAAPPAPSVTSPTGPVTTTSSDGSTPPSSTSTTVTPPTTSTTAPTT